MHAVKQKPIVAISRGMLCRASLRVFLCVVLLAGCATGPEPLPLDVRMHLGKVYLSSTGTTGNTFFNADYAKDKLAAEAGKAGAGPLPLLIFGGPVGAAVFLTALPIYAAMGAIAAHEKGRSVAIPGDTVNKIEAKINSALHNTDLSPGLVETLDALSQQDPDLAPYDITHGVLPDPKKNESLHAVAAKWGYDTVMEIKVTRSGFDGGIGNNPKIHFSMAAQVKLINAKSGSLISEDMYSYTSKSHPAAFWFDNEYREILEELVRANIAIGNNIIDDVFLVEFPFGSGTWLFPTSKYFGSCWLSPVYPPLEYPPTKFGNPLPELTHAPYNLVGSRQPLLQWETFPRPRDTGYANRKVLSTISNVRYDVKIWESIKDAPEKLIYDERDLVRPSFQPPEPLDAKSRYIWTFRARFNMAGKRLTTPWAFSFLPRTEHSAFDQMTCETKPIPPKNYYRFKTP